MKKRLIVVLAVLATVVGMAFAATYTCSKCGQKKAATKNGICADCQEKMEKNSSNYESMQGKYCTPDKKDSTSAALWDELNCDDYNN